MSVSPSRDDSQSLVTNKIAVDQQPAGYFPSLFLRSLPTTPSSEKVAKVEEDIGTLNCLKVNYGYKLFMDMQTKMEQILDICSWDWYLP